jgi:hypothetical protein
LSSCSGISITVGGDGRATFNLAANAAEGIAIHIDAKLQTSEKSHLKKIIKLNLQRRFKKNFLSC